MKNLQNKIRGLSEGGETQLLQPTPEPKVVTEAVQGDVEIIEKLAEEWRKLCEEGPYDEPFYRPEWIAAHVRAFAPRKKLFVVTARLNGQLCAVLPLVKERTLFYGLPVKKLRSAANDHSVRFDLVHGRGCECSAAAQAIWGLLKATPNWDVLEVRNAPEGGAFDHLLEEAQRDGYLTGRWESLRSPFITLRERNGSAASKLRPRSSNLRSTLDRILRKLGSQGSLRLERVDQADPKALQRFYDLERSGWKGQEDSAIAYNEKTRQFYDEVGQAAARFGYLSLYFLELKGRTIAAHFGLACRGRYFMPKCAYDEDFSQFAPGHLIVHAILGDLVERGFCEYDFTGAFDEWKAKWTHNFRRHAWRFVFNEGLIGSAAYALKFRLGPVLRRKLSD